mgnify:CR=1 FL=1
MTISSHRGRRGRGDVKAVPGHLMQARQLDPDDIKAQLGATITHRQLTRLFRDRGVTLDATYQLNTGGNTDFLNMLSRDRLVSKTDSHDGDFRAELLDHLNGDSRLFRGAGAG